MIAHAVGHYSALLGRCDYNLSSRTHAESIHAPAAAAAVIKLIIGCRKSQLRRRSTVLGYIYHFLGMFDSNPYGKRLGGHVNALLPHPSEGVSCAVSYSKYGRLTVKGAAVGKADSFKPAFIQAYSVCTAAEPDFPSKALDFLTYVLYHISEYIRTYMRLLPVKNIFRSSCPCKLLQNLSYAWILDSRSQLAVAEGSGTSLSELHVAFRVKLSLFPEVLHGRRSFIHVTAPFQYYRPVSCSCKNQPCKHSCRTEADYYRSVLHRFRLRVT